MLGSIPQYLSNPSSSKASTIWIISLATNAVVNTDPIFDAFCAHSSALMVPRAQSAPSVPSELFPAIISLYISYCPISSSVHSNGMVFTVPRVSNEMMSCSPPVNLSSYSSLLTYFRLEGKIGDIRNKRRGKAHDALPPRLARSAGVSEDTPL